MVASLMYELFNPSLWDTHQNRMDEGRKLLIGTNLASEQLIECQVLTFIYLSFPAAMSSGWGFN